MAGDRVRTKWRRKLPPWHMNARLIAALVLLDQYATLTGMPRSEAIVVACIGAFFAPIPTTKRKE